VVRASYRLSAEAKHVWRIVNEFDRSAGCWASLPLLAKLVGIPCDRFQAHVDSLVGLDLLTQVQQGNVTILFATLPKGMPADSRLERQDKLLCAERLDRHIHELRLTPQDIRDKELPANEGDCSPAKGSPAVTAVHGQAALETAGTAGNSDGTPSKDSPENGNGGSPGTADVLVSDVADRLRMPDDPEAKAQAARQRWQEVGAA